MSRILRYNLRHSLKGTAEPPPDTSDVIIASLRNWSESSGTKVVSNPIPLTPGLLFPNQLATVSVWAGTPLTEQAIYIEALKGRYNDGSLMCILIQFSYSFATGDNSIEIPAEIRLGNTRGTVDISKTLHSDMFGFTVNEAAPANSWTFIPLALRNAPWRAGLAEASCLPTSPTYLLTTEIFPATLSYASVQAAGGLALQMQQFWDTWEQHYNDIFRATTEANFPAENDYELMFTEAHDYYGISRAYFQQFLRTGDAKNWARGCSVAWLKQCVFGRNLSSPWLNSQINRVHPEQTAYAYLMTGDPGMEAIAAQGNFYLGKNAGVTGWGDRFGVWSPNITAQSRGMARQMQICIWGLRFQLLNQPYASRASEFLDRAFRRGSFAGGTAPGPSGGTLPISYQIDNGLPFGFADDVDPAPLPTWYFNREGVGGVDVNGSENFQFALWIDELINYRTWIAPDPDIDTVIVNWADWLVDSAMWVDSGKGPMVFRYANITMTDGGGAGTHTDTINLNGMFLRSIGEAYRITGAQKYLNVITLLAQGMLMTPRNGGNGPFIKTLAEWNAISDSQKAVCLKVFSETLSILNSSYDVLIAAG